MAGMFFYASKFNQPLSTFNTQNVKDMQHMFFRTSSFNQALITFTVNNSACHSNLFLNSKIANRLKKHNFFYSNKKTLEHSFFGMTRKKALLTFFTSKIENYSQNVLLCLLIEWI